MKKSISYWSFSGGLDGSKRVAEAFTEAKAVGFEAVEVCLLETGDVSLASTEADLTRVKRQVDDTISELRQEIDMHVDLPEDKVPEFRPPAGERAPREGSETPQGSETPARRITLPVPEADDYLLPLEVKNAGLSEASRRIEQQYAAQSEPHDPSDYLGGGAP